ncbi:hypothetical protein ONZ45_g15083 [Pleurotus djamor]|nr:hypothetical protein ONZ45_g15083 [Pleurotus djamor]
MYRAISDTTGEHSSDLARSLRNLAIELSINDQHEPALNAATEALMLQRQESDRIAQIQSAWIIWEARGDEVVVLSSSRSLARTQHTAFEEGLCLQQLAICLSSLKRYTEALIAANEAINCFQALVNSYPGSYERRLEEVQVNRSSWYAITNGGCTCSICLNKEAERPPIVEEIPDPEVASDVPESSKELIRI